MGPALRVRLLGGLELRLDGRPLPPVESARAESLLAFLLLHRQAPQPRQRQAFGLWPDSTEAQARTNLRHVLHNLRRALPDLDRFLEVTPRTLRWRAEATGGWTSPPSRRPSPGPTGRGQRPLPPCGRRVALYQGDLLKGRHDEYRDPSDAGGPRHAGGRRLRPLRQQDRDHPCRDRRRLRHGPLRASLQSRS
jgi:hypothetical protein